MVEGRLEPADHDRLERSDDEGEKGDREGEVVESLEIAEFERVEEFVRSYLCLVGIFSVRRRVRIGFRSIRGRRKREIRELSAYGRRISFYGTFPRTTVASARQGAR